MKFLVSQFTYFLSDPQAKRNLSALRTYLYFLFGIIAIYSVLFHVLMAVVEDQQHSWLTGLYWTLTVMSTLGFGDITFHSDIGRLFSLVVLGSGVFLLLIMLPFAFIRFFYAPWLEAQIRAKVPRRLPEHVRDHVIIVRPDSITSGLIRKLRFNNIPYVLLEPDTVVAAQLRDDGFTVVAGEVDDPETYKAVNVHQARLLLANADDPTNTNILLTVRSLNSTVPIIALAEEEDSLDIFSLSGATYPLPLKMRLGEQLATRVSVGSGTAHVVGRFKDLLIVEFLVHDSNLSGISLREARLRERTGMNVVGIWEGGHLQPVRPDQPLADTAVPVAIGTEEQVDKLNALLGCANNLHHSVLVIGGGKVGRCTAAALMKRGITVRLLDRDPALRPQLETCCDYLTIGDAADRTTIDRAGIGEVSAVALTTNDDAQNIHLAVYCRRLRPQLNIVSRVTRERNIEAIYRAGADFVLSYASLGREYITAYLLGREPVMVGEGADFYSVKVPPALAGKTLAESGIGAQTGLVVIAIETDAETLSNPPASTLLVPASRLLMLGTHAQRERFAELFA
ncbi:MAG TPA: NAD-binding protein [Oceanipulchritudo sp.]|nr:NAD-binding protein [Oceanipulchritudo sp.]